ncbi:MAG: hypothetical protein ALECFALPRED_006211 [Alectoria fallacina]|uniref:Isopropylmalate dehydrogenase-like domain-containing protein n=1 Tax=Alectoria fallacina TaxID=1903189 RepID=A0A8H3G1N5_9LECA|nr:MAG: hypothetical protein ALECFALPRED_006211 [Alectoria fallacina]
MIPQPELLEVGVAVGQGTGPELADVFVEVLSQLARHFSLQIKVHRSSRIYHSYQSLFSAGAGLQHIRDETSLDATHYEDFCKKQAAQGTNVIFRTAFTAQSLYLVRQQLEAVKVEHFHNPSAEILLIRDQAQGFYTGFNAYSVDALSVSRTSHFDKAIFGRIVTYSLLRARRCWGKDFKIESLTLVYKHHLFDGIFDVWAQEWSQEHGLSVRFVQPDTMNRNILAFGVQGRQLIIASNEYADIMEVLFLDMFDLGVQETSYSENVYLSPATSELVEYQTVHGSADDLTGKGIVNPSATLKAAATILERHGLCKGIESNMNHTIGRMAQRKYCTPDQGGTATTAAYVSAVLHYLADLYSKPNISSLNRRLSVMPTLTETRTPRPNLPTLGLKTALLIIDFQQDFADSINASSPPLSTINSNISHLLSHIRNAQNQALSSVSSKPISASSSIKDIEIIHIRFLGDRAYQFAPWTYRNTTSNRPDKCVSGTDGASFLEPIVPQKNERVFEKPSLFDPFMIPDFETYLRGKGIEHLILAGLYGDVCLDSTARSGFQKGFWISIMKGCVGNLHLSLEDWERFAREVYGAKMLSLKEFETSKDTEDVESGKKEGLKAKL